MHTQPSLPGFLAIHPPRRLWPSMPVVYCQTLPLSTPATQHKAPAQQPSTR